MHFTKEYIDELLQRIDLYEIMKEAGAEVKNGAGKNAFYVASWCCGKTDYDNGRIDKIRNTYKCMACGDGGNAIHFLREIKDMSFKDAVIFLAKVANMDLPSTEENKQQKRRNQALKLAAEFYATHANDYFLSRGISKEVIENNQLGYAPGGRSLRSFLEEKGYSKQELLDYSLINARGMDFMFYRAVIPYFLNGRVVALYGRAVDDQKTRRRHVYINGEFVLGGVDQVDPERIVNIFESGIDRLVAASYGVDNGVDPGGAAKFNASHARLLKQRGVKQCCIMFDGDQAGRKGAYEAGQYLLQEGIKVWVVELPNERDPAELLQAEGLQGFMTYTRAYKEYEEFKAFYELDQLPIDLIKKYINEKEGMNR